MKQGWKTCKFADVFDLQMGKTPSRDNPTYWGDDNMWVSIADMNEQKYMSATKEGITDVAVQESGIKPIPKGTVIMSFKLSIGKVSIATSKLYTNEAIMGFIEKEEGTLVPEYLYYYLKGYKWEGANKAAMGMTLNKKTIAENTISYPPVAEQEKIVAELDCLSGIIDKKKQQLKGLDNLAQSIFYEMFGDPVENDKGWDIYALSKNVKVKGRVGWKGYKKEDLRDSGPLAIGGGHLTDSGGIDLSSPVFLSMEKYLESPEIMIEVGDIILVQRGTIGKVGLIANDIGMATINPCVLILRPENLNAIYLLHYFLNQSTQKHLKTLIKGVAQPMITQQQVNGLLLPIPPLYLQQEFASKIETIEKQKELISQSIKETETLFNSRMDYYFGSVK